MIRPIQLRRRRLVRRGDLLTKRLSMGCGSLMPRTVSGTAKVVRQPDGGFRRAGISPKDGLLRRGDGRPTGFRTTLANDIHFG
jgi:hypothetical protein